MVSCSSLEALLDEVSNGTVIMEAIMRLKTTISHRCSIRITTNWWLLLDHLSIQHFSMAWATMSFLHNISPQDFNQLARSTTSHNMVVYQWLTLPMELDANRKESTVHRLLEYYTAFSNNRHILFVIEILKRHVSRICLPVFNVNGCAEIKVYKNSYRRIWPVVYRDVFWHI